MSVGDPVLQQQVHVLYRDHHGWLHGWLRKRLGCSQQAADLAHDTFLRIMTAGRAPDSLHEPRAYLTTVAKGLVVNWYRRQALERAWLEALALLPEPEAPSPEHQFIILETLHEIDAMLDALPARTRRVFLLSQLEGMKYEDIAILVGASLATVKRDMKLAFRHCLALMP